MREQQIGHVVIDSTVRPALVAILLLHAGRNRDFVRTNPVATKRTLCAGSSKRQICAPTSPSTRVHCRPRLYQAVRLRPAGDKEAPHGQWREYDAEDTLRFYALRLRELGMLKRTPQSLLAQGTDWSFLNELKREMRT